jgi:long-subunit fatty acid transport protein
MSACPARRSSRAALLTAAMTAFAASVAPAGAHAAGFYVGDVGVRGLARGGAFVAAPDSPLALHYNPGALTLLPKGLSVEIDLSAVSLDYRFDRRCPCVSPSNPDAARLDAELSASPAFNEVSINQAGPQPIPFVMAAYQFEPMKLTIGVGAYGLTSPGRLRYGELDANLNTQAQRYSLVGLELFEAFYNLGAAIEPIPGLRIGGVAQLYELRVTQRLALWANSATFASTPEDDRFDIPVTLAFAAPLRLNWSLGVSYTPQFFPNLSIGVSALGKRSSRANGTVDIGVPRIIADVGGRVDGRNVEVELNLPATLRGGIEYRQPGIFKAEAAVVVEAWEVYDQVVVRNKDVGIVIGTQRQDLGTIVIPTRFRNTYSIRVGGELDLFEPWLGVRAGYFFEPGAIADANLDGAAPDLTKHGFGFGLSTTFYGTRLEVGGAVVVMPSTTVRDSTRQMAGPLVPPIGSDALLTTIGNGTYSGSYFIGGASLSFSLERLWSSLEPAASGAGAPSEPPAPPTPATPDAPVVTAPNAS